MKKKLKIKLLILLAILAAAIILGITKGSVNFSLTSLLLPENQAILDLRLLRVLVAGILGAGLAVCGVSLQAILRNPLAEPYLLGTSSGAGLAAVLAIIFGIFLSWLPLVAFIGAILTVAIVYNLAKEYGRISAQSLILSGVIASIALSGIMVALISLSGNEALHGIMWWLWGSTQVYNLKLIFLVCGIVISGIIAMFIMAQDLNAISLGEEEATHLGINIEAVKKILFFITSVVTASLVCICGIVGFAGLIVPHMMRLIVGPNHKNLIPATALSGAAFMIACDIFSRTLFSPQEIPIGVITAIIGAPVFIILLKAKQKVR